jgi:hypothetical protein
VRVIILDENFLGPIPMAALSKAQVCGRSYAGIASSNSAGGVDIFCERCLLSGRGLWVGLITLPEEPN